MSLIKKILLFLLIPAFCFAYEPKAKQIYVDDAGNYYTSTDMEGVLQEIGADLAAGTSTDNIVAYENEIVFSNNLIVSN